MESWLIGVMSPSAIPRGDNLQLRDHVDVTTAEIWVMCDSVVLKSREMRQEIGLPRPLTAPVVARGVCKRSFLRVTDSGVNFRIFLR